MPMTMTPITPTRNFSIFTLPAYFLLAIAPHIYSTQLLKQASSSTSSSSTSDTKTPSSSSGPSSPPKPVYNLANPRSTENAGRYRSRLPPAVYARYERARAAHTNMLENAAFVAAAVLAGAVARLDAAYMNWMCALYLASRVGYTVTYIGVGAGPWALMRTGWYAAGCAVLFGVWWEAGKVVMNGEY